MRPEVLQFAPGRLDVDAGRAADQLNWLITSDPLNRAMLRGEDDPLPRRERDRPASARTHVGGP